MAPPVNTRTLANYLASLSATPSEDATLVTQNLQVYSTANLLTSGDVSQVAVTGQYSDLLGLPVLGTAAAQDVSYFALAASGALAETALQPSDVGTMAYEDVGDFATYAQGQRADSAVQTIVAGANISIDNTDPNNPIITSTAAGTGDVSGPAGAVAGNIPAFSGTSGKILNDSGFSPTSFATATQGGKADTALQPAAIGTTVQGYSAVLQATTASFTTADETKLDGIQAGAEVNVNADWNAVSGDAQILNKPTLGTLAALNSINNANWSGTDLSIANGGTGASDAATARTNLGAQPADADLTSWAGVTRASGFDAFAATPSSANLRSLLTDETGTGSAVFATSPTLVTPNLGTPSAINLANATNFPAFVESVIAGTNVSIDNTDPQNPIISATGGGGGGGDVFGPASSVDENFVRFNGTSGKLIEDSGLSAASFATATQGGKADTALQPAAIGVTVQGFDANLASWAGVTRASGFDSFAATPSSANLRALLSDEVGTGSAYFVGGALGTPASVTLTNGTGLPLTTGVTGTLPVANGGSGAATLTGLIKGNGTSPFTSATAGTDYYAPGSTDVSVADGGTGASTASAARTNLGVEIGVNVQAYDADLQSWAGVTRATGFDAFAATPSSANLAALLTDETGTGASVFATSPTLVTPNLGTPSAATLTNATGLPISTGVSGLGTGVATFLATPSSANLRAALTDETGTGVAYFVGGALGTPASGTATNITGLPIVGGTTGTLTVARGGTGATTLTGLLKGNGTSAFTAATAGTDYYAPGGTDVAVADGGTGSSTASGARTNLGLVPGADIQAYSAQLAQIAALIQTGNAGKVIAVNATANGYELVAAGGGTVIQSIQTGFVNTTSASAGSGEDQRYVDVTISSVNTAKAVVMPFQGGQGSSVYNALSVSGTQQSWQTTSRLTSSTNLRISTFNETGATIYGRWIVVEYT